MHHRDVVRHRSEPPPPDVPAKASPPAGPGPPTAHDHSHPLQALSWEAEGQSGTPLLGPVPARVVASETPGEYEPEVPEP